MANLDKMEKKVDEMHEAIIQQQTLMANVVVTKDACEKKRKEIYETINGCAETQCTKISKAGKAGKTAMLIAGAVGSMVAIAIAILIYLVTRGQ